MIQTRRISIIGLGWLGRPLALHLIQAGYPVVGSTTSNEKLAELQAQAINAHLLQLNPQPEGALTTLLQAEVLIVNVPPKAGKMGDTFHPQQMQYLAEAVRHSPVQWVLYVSSTSVYPELNQVVTEDDVQTSAQSAAPALVQAEQIWQKLAETGRQVTILRCGGLMGYDRQAGKYVAGRTVDSGDVPVNYLHRDDAVGLITSVLSLNLTGVYNLVAPEHPVRAEVYRTNCEKYGYEFPNLIGPGKPHAFKVVSAQKVIQQTGYVFTYPDPRSF